MKSKFTFSLLSILSLAALVGCQPKVSLPSAEKPTEEKPTEKVTEQGKESTSNKDPNAYVDEKYPTPDKKVELTRSAYYDNNDRHRKFLEGSAAKLPYTGADGTTYKAGDFKPVWRQRQKDLNRTIDDVSPNGKISIKNNFDDIKSKGFKSGEKVINVAQGNSDQILAAGTDLKKPLVNLGDHLNERPNFKKFLEDYPAVKKIITASDGGIYYAPYFDGFDDIERRMMVRQDWVEKLLDGDRPTTGLGNVDLANKEYQPTRPDSIDTNIDAIVDGVKGTVTKKYAAGKGIIARRNAAEHLNGATAVQILRQYIDDTYGNAYGQKRSELFCGGKAVYDADEMVALFRCVKLNGEFLTGKADLEIVPFFPRANTNDRLADRIRLLQFWGVRGTESRNLFRYVGRDGKLADARGTEKFRKGLDILHQLYAEGLIYKDFGTKDSVTNGDFRGYFLKHDLGFATYDYNQTTTIYNDNATASALNGGKFLFSSILPAVADWDDGVNGNYIHYTESWRSVKPQGWFITSQTTGDKLERALTRFDYLYSVQGNRLRSYGPDKYLAHNADGSIKGRNYQGKVVPVLSDACKQEMATLTGGNYTNYYRYYLGGTFPVGYVKEQGREFQTVSTKAQASLNDINEAIALGVLQHVNHKSGNASHRQDIVPTTLPFTEAENSSITTEFTAVSKFFTVTKGEPIAASRYTIIQNGFGKIGDYNITKENYLDVVNNQRKLSGLVKYYNDAYIRYLAQ